MTMVSVGDIQGKYYYAGGLYAYKPATSSVGQCSWRLCDVDEDLVALDSNGEDS
jgi:hypothetical protein